MTGTGLVVDEPAAPPAPPLSIGPLSIWPPVVLAPMAGVTSAPFRELCRDAAAAPLTDPSRPGPVAGARPGLFVSEMITARAVVERNARTFRMAAFGPDERPRSLQLYGTSPAVLGEAVRIVVGELGVEHVDLNFGCPAAKVTRKGGGAALPVRRRLLTDIVAAAVRAAGEVPVTVKFRKGVDDDHLTFLHTGRTAAAEGAAAVALHARTAWQHYAGEADWAAIAELKQAVSAESSIPVLGNGDIWEAGDALAMMRTTGCDGVVVGRGCLGRPWLFAELTDAFLGNPPAEPPDFGATAALLLRHARLLVDWKGDDDIRELRRHAAWYVKGYPVGGDVRRRLTAVATIEELEQVLAEVVAEVGADLALPAEARRTARGHTSGPHAVALPHGWYDLVDDPTPPAGADTLVSGG